MDSKEIAPQSRVRTLFLGTGEFAVPVLQSLVEAGFIDVVGVVTQPDKLAGREQSINIIPVKQLVDSYNHDDSTNSLRLYQPEKLRLDAEQILAETNPQLIIVAAYGQMVPQVMLESPKYKCLNLHGSLLPELRGAVPVPMAILQGLSKTGVTLQQMVKELDAGPVLARVEMNLVGSETTDALMAELAALGAKLMISTLPAYFAGEIQPQPQDETQATFCYEADIAKDKAELRIDTPVDVAERMVRAFYPWPVVWANIPVNGQTKRLKIFKAQITPGAQVTPTDQLRVRRAGKQLFLDLQDGTLELLELQLEGKKRGSAVDYLFLS